MYRGLLTSPLHPPRPVWPSHMKIAAVNTSRPRDFESFLPPKSFAQSFHSPQKDWSEFADRHNSYTSFSFHPVQSSYPFRRSVGEQVSFGNSRYFTHLSDCSKSLRLFTQSDVIKHLAAAVVYNVSPSSMIHQGVTTTFSTPWNHTQYLGATMHHSAVRDDGTALQNDMLRSATSAQQTIDSLTEDGERERDPLECTRHKRRFTYKQRLLRRSSTKSSRRWARWNGGEWSRLSLVASGGFCLTVYFFVFYQLSVYILKLGHNLGNRIEGGSHNKLINLTT